MEPRVLSPMLATCPIPGRESPALLHFTSRETLSSGFLGQTCLPGGCELTTPRSLLCTPRGQASGRPPRLEVWDLINGSSGIYLVVTKTCTLWMFVGLDLPTFPLLTTALLSLQSYWNVSVLIPRLCGCHSNLLKTPLCKGSLFHPGSCSLDGFSQKCSGL